MIITPEIVIEFREEFNGQFSQLVVWSDQILTRMLRRADFITGGSGWGPYDTGGEYSLKQDGMFLYCAAMLEAFYAGDPANGIAPEARLNVAQKSVGDESIGYRVAAMMGAENDFLTYTVYGQLFYGLRKLAYLGARAV